VELALGSGSLELTPPRSARAIAPVFPTALLRDDEVDDLSETPKSARQLGWQKSSSVELY
jgi:hypothetical protein